MGVVTGVFIYPNGSPVANGLYQWKLNVDAVELGTACVAPVLISGNLDSSGNMTATFLFNDILGTAGGTTTTYQLTVKDNHGSQVWNENYYLTGTAANVNLVLPGSGSAGTIFFPVFPSGAATPDSVQSIAATSLVGFAGATNTLVKAVGGAGGITITAVTAVGVPGQSMKIIKVDASAGNVVVTGTASQLFNQYLNLTLTNQWQMYTLESDNANWMVVAAAG